MRFSSRQYFRRRGMALVAVLALIVILSVILVAFVSQSRVEVTASNSFSSAVAADSLARDAANSVIGSLQYEMEAGSKTPISTVNGFTVYEPAANINLIPRLDALAATTNVPTLLRTSRAGSLYEGASRELPASSVTTDQASVEGRKISLRRWNYPRLLTREQNESTGLVAPAWIYVNRAGPVKLTAWSDTLSRSMVSGDINPSYVIGRYAFRIYDVSGLIDVNVAGYPGINPPTGDRIGRKGGLSWAKLREAGFPGWIPDATQPLDIANWRWPTVDYDAFVDDGGVRSGFLKMPSSVAGVNRFLDRSDFLGFLKNAPAQFPLNDSADFATQCTTFSRERNAPSWKPSSAPVASPAAMNPFIPAVRVSAGFTRKNGQPALVGEPLVGERFPLSKIELFKNPEANAAAIRSYFGLVTNNDGTWVYDAGTNTTGVGFSDGTGQSRERLKTLEEVASENREPNFFELLQAAIQADSLGLAAKDDRGYGTSGFSHTWSDKNIARHVLQIGANIIDQYDEDNDPTVIRRPDALKWVPANPDSDIAGVENTPFIQIVAPTVFRDLTKPDVLGSDGLMLFPTVSGYMQFQLWNPHRNAGSAPEGTYRIVAKGSLKTMLTAGRRSSFSDIESPARSLDIDSTPNNPSQLAFSTGTEKFSEPRMLRHGDVTAQNAKDRYKGTTGWGTADIAGFYSGDLSAPYARVRQATPTADGTSHYEIYGEDGNDTAFAHAGEPGSTIFFQLQKLDSEDRWIPVQTLPFTFDNEYTGYNFSETLQVKPGTGGQPDEFRTYDLAGPPLNRIQQGSGSHYYHGGYKDSTGAIQPYVRRVAALGDPRTNRFGTRLPSSATTLINTGSRYDTITSRFGGWLAANTGKPVSVPATGASGLDFPVYKTFDNRNASTFSVRDRGPTSQPFRLADVGVKNRSTPASPYTGGASARPLVLNRPFKSVSEMGQASRDIPWRSLNFVNDVENPLGATPVVAPADSALLDLFTIDEMPTYRAGVINLNSASQIAIKAILIGSSLGDASSPEAVLSDTEANTAAEAIYTYLGSGKRLKTTSDNILATPADIARMIQSLSDSGQPLDGWAKEKKEMLVAALAQAHNSRTWNLLIDVIAQSGKFPPQANSLQKFAVTGEKRLLVHVAIDRYTGQVVDRQVEQVSQD